MEGYRMAGMVKCPFCGKEIEPGSNDCPGCGNDLTILPKPEVSRLRLLFHPFAVMAYIAALSVLIVLLYPRHSPSQ